MVTVQLGRAKNKEILEKILTKNGNNHGKYFKEEERYFRAKERVELKGFIAI
jgi:hypothetical protein